MSERLPRQQFWLSHGLVGVMPLDVHMDINWYPGHMAKTRRMIRELLKVIDAVVEVVDARIPKSSRNPELPRLTGTRPRVIAMTKADLADPAATTEWLQVWRQAGVKAVALDLRSQKGAGPLKRLLEEIVCETDQRMVKKGRRSRPLRVLVAGVPNAGKSTLINRLAGRTRARAGAKAGVTRGKQWIRVGSRMQLLDTPGILWPKLEDPETAFRLAVTGAISDEAYDWQQAAVLLAEFLVKEYPEALTHRYGIEHLPGTGLELVEAVGRRRGFLVSGGRVDFEKSARLLLQEFRSGKLGRITLDSPGAGAV